MTSYSELLTAYNSAKADLPLALSYEADNRLEDTDPAIDVLLKKWHVWDTHLISVAIRAAVTTYAEGMRQCVTNGEVAWTALPVELQPPHP